MLFNVTKASVGGDTGAGFVRCAAPVLCVCLSSSALGTKSSVGVGEARKLACRNTKRTATGDEMQQENKRAEEENPKKSDCFINCYVRKLAPLAVRCAQIRFGTSQHWGNHGVKHSTWSQPRAPRASQVGFSGVCERADLLISSRALPPLCTTLQRHLLLLITVYHLLISISPSWSIDAEIESFLVRHPPGHRRLENSPILLHV